MLRPTRLILRFCAILAVGSILFAILGTRLIPEIGAMGDGMKFNTSRKIALPELVEGSTVLDMHGEPMGKLVGAENRIVVPLSDISDEMRSTVLAVEDADFYKHHGVSAKSILRALQANSDKGSVAQGGSTITQQLVKLSIVGDEESMARKIKEASLAIQLEDQVCEKVKRRICKNQILGQYLNTVYLGRGAYGVEAAARLYFGVSASELDWGQSAVLTSLIRNPNGYDPIRFPDVAERRREVVVGRMLETGLITDSEAELIKLSPLPREVHSTPSSSTSVDLSYYERKVRDELLDAEWLAPSKELRRNLIFNGGLTITSTYEPRAQFLAQIASDSNPLKKANPDTVAVVAVVEPSTGAVRAVIGQKEIGDRGLVELATPLVGRSPGSSFKAFTLLAALEEGYSIKDSISASPAPRSLYKKWGIKASTWPSECRGGHVTLAKATASSNNCAFVRLQQVVGGAKVVDIARRLGIRTIPDEAANYPSLTLGGTTVRPLEMAGAYAAIANDGVFNPPHFVSKVTDREGKVLFEYKPSTTQAIPVEVARQATVALEGVVTGGTYAGGRLPNRQPAAGKTGTNEAEGGGNTDVWFIGFTPQIATAVWIGDPLGQIDMKGGRVQGGTMAGRVWRTFMAPYLDGTETVDFTPPRKVTTRAKSIPDPWKSYGSTSSRSRSSRSRTTSNSSRTSTTVPSESQSGSSGSGSSGSGSGDSGGGSGATGSTPGSSGSGSSPSPTTATP
ncbi:MAG: transglycosylase domain-containing protein [Microthrixaceae bacterium]